MQRRHFLQTAFGTAASTALWGARTLRATDVVQLGPDKIRLTRLAIGTGTKGGSIQRLLGVEGVADMLQSGYDQGVFFWETADSYRTHPHVAAALKRVPREKVTLMTKTPARTADEMRTALDRYRKELGTDYIDIVLLHALRTAT
jgi:predicted aldo/keto reductase-like oxidoreductase